MASLLSLSVPSLQSRTYARVASFLARRADRAQARAEGYPVSDTRRIMTQEEAIALGQFVRTVNATPDGDVSIRHQVTAITMRRPDGTPRLVDVDELALEWLVKLGVIDRFEGQVWVRTNVRDPETLQHVLQQAVRPIPVPPLSDEEREERATWDKMFQPHTYTYLPTTIWQATTAAALETQRGAMLGRLLAPLTGTPWRVAGTVGVSELGFCTLNTAMQTTHWGEATDSELSVTLYSADGMTSGWSGHAHRNWDKLEPERVAHEALTIATQHLHAVRAEPGRYTAILSATAMGQLLRAMARFFNVETLGPFSYPHQVVGARDKRGQQLFDSRITLTTDPTDPEGGDFPFFPGGNPYPSGKVTWMENGVLKRRSASVGLGLQYGMTPLRDPECVRMSGGPTSIDEMIANCERGLYVHRLSAVHEVDALSGTMEGFTRHGCLLIQNGKITHPVKDFRFRESPFLALNRVLALGTPQRVAFGFQPPHENQPWPLPPVIAPPVMVRDFNFSALADNA